jgi:hypothetical protein
MTYRSRNRRRYMLAHALTNAVVDAQQTRQERAHAELDAKCAAIMADVAERQMLRAEDEDGAQEWDTDDSLLDRVMEDIAASRGGTR